MAKGPVISKSKYIAALQCPKLLWYMYNRKKDIPPPEPATELAFEEGHKVGDLAQTLYPAGKKVEWDYDPEKVMGRSMAALKEKKPVFEAGFINNSAYAITDLLIPAEDGKWDIIEVKSATEVKNEYINDAAFQKYTCEGAGVPINKIYLMHINRDFVKQGPIDPKKLFLKVDITAESERFVPQIKEDLKSMLEFIAQKEVPDIKIGPHCNRPRECPLKDLCFSFLPEDHIFILFRGSKQAFDLYERGILKLEDVPPDVELSDKQALQIKLHGKKDVHVEKGRLKEFLNDLRYPLYFLDFETIAPAIPVYDQTRPYQDVFFQYSLHVVEKPGGKVKHFEYLAEGKDDPRPEVLKKLKAELGFNGSIIAYNAIFEQKCIRTAAEAYPEYLEWDKNIDRRFVDLYAPFKSFFYYNPKQNGSASMKAILPAMTGLTYDKLEIGNGGTARAEYSRITFHQDIPKAEKDRVREALLKYCELDTFGMVKILEALEAAANS